MATIVKSHSFNPEHLTKLAVIERHFLETKRIRRANQSDVLRILIEDFNLPDWSTGSNRLVDQENEEAAE